MQEYGAWPTNQRRAIGLGLIVIGIGVLVVGIGVALPALMFFNSGSGAAGSLTIPRSMDWLRLTAHAM